MKKNYLIISATIVLLVIVFLIYKLVSTKDEPCGGIFQQTAVQLTSSLKVLQHIGSVTVGDQKIQDLTEAAQIVALNLKTCCIMNMKNKISGEQFLQCQQIGDTYNKQVNELSKNIDAAEQAKKNGDSSTMHQTLGVIGSQLTGLQHSVEQITGKALSFTTTTSPAVSTSAKINLINIKSGGHVLIAPAENWARTIDSSEEEIILSCNNCDGVFGFKDARKATFDMFCMLIPASTLNVKEFELYYGNDSPSGKFDLISRFQTQNARLFDTPYQQFKFPAVTAKFFKIKIISYWGNSIGYVNEFQLWGSLK